MKQNEPHTLNHEEVRKLLSAPPDNTDWGLRDRALLHLLYTAGLRCSELSAVRIRDLDFLLNQVRVNDAPGASSTETCADFNSASLTRSSCADLPGASSTGSCADLPGASSTETYTDFHCISSKKAAAGYRCIPFDEAASDILQRYIRCCHDDFTSRDSLLFPGRGNRPMTRQGIWKLVRKYGAQAGIPSPVTPQRLRESRRAELLGMGVPPERVARLLGQKE